MAKKIYHVTLTLAIQLVIIVGLLEVSLRILEPHYHNIRLLLYNPHILGSYERINSLEALLNTRPKGFQPAAKREGFVLNSKSFRTGEYSETKPKGQSRILVIGDSFVAASGGVPYAQHWAVLLEQQLKHQGTSVEVIKLGVGGVGPRFELRLWELEGRKLQADWVVLAFCIGNDFTDEQISQQTLAERVVANSYVMRLLRNLQRLSGVAKPAEIFVKTGGYATTDNVYDPHKPSFTREVFLKIVASRMAITHKTEQARFAQLFDNLKPVLSWFQESVKRTKAQWMVMLIPDEYQVYPSLFQEVVAQLGHRLADYDVDLPQRQLIEWFKQKEIMYLDLLPSFRKAANTTTLYKLQDTHWNIEGNRLASEELTKFMMSVLQP